MAFTRDDIKSYEAQKPAAVPDPVKPVSATPAAPTPAPAPEASSAPVADSVPADSGDASSAEIPAVSAPAAAELESGSTPLATPEPAAPASKTIPYERFQEVIDERNALKKYGEMLFERFEALQKPATETPAAPVAASPTPAPASAPEAELLPPTLQSVNYDEAAYQKEMAKWAATVARREATVVARQETQQRTSEQIIATYNEREAAFAAKNPTFREVTKIPLPKFAPDTAHTILTDTNGPAVVNHLATHPDEAVRLSRMTPAQQLVRLGQIIGQVSVPVAASKPAAKAATPRTVTQAPPPPKVTPGGTAPVQTGMPPSMAEFAAQERAKKIQDREARAKMRTAMR